MAVDRAKMHNLCEDMLNKALDILVKSSNVIDSQRLDDYIALVIATVGEPFLSKTDLNYMKDNKSYMLGSYYFKDFFTRLFDKERVDARIKFINEFNEEYFEKGKKIYEYFDKIGLSSLPYYFRNGAKDLAEYYKKNEKYDENVVPGNDFSELMNSDLVIRFTNAFSKESKFVPGQFVLVKLGQMPNRVLDGLPQHSKNYVWGNSSKDLCSAGIILDVVNDKIIQVKDKGRWYKVAVSTPFSIFCVEERHLKKYTPTSDNVKDLLERSKLQEKNN